MIDWQSYGPIYTVAPGIKKIGELPIIEFDEEENRYLNLKEKQKRIYTLTKCIHLITIRSFVKKFNLSSPRNILLN